MPGYGSRVKVHVAFTPAEEASAPVGIVVDVLRASSTIAQALAAGYRRVLCCAEIDEARALRASLPDSLLGGEREAIRIEGFDVGASPRRLAGRMALLLRVLPGGDLQLRLLARQAIGLLNFPRELLALAGDRLDLLGGEPAPVPQGVALEMLPVAGDAMPLHWISLPRGEPKVS